MKKVNIIFILVLFNSIFFHANANECGDPFKNHFGPFDYTSPSSRQLGYAGSKTASILSTVESGHFTKNVASLKSGKHNGQNSPLPDLAYTLNVFPNHHLALVAISKFQRIRGNGDFKKYGIYTADCYINRAIRFKPKDPIVRMIYGIHLHFQGKYKEALEQYKIAEKIIPNNQDLLYNMGLVYLKLEKPDTAKKYADKVYKNGYPLPGLKKKLIKLGHWPKK